MSLCHNIKSSRSISPSKELPQMIKSIKNHYYFLIPGATSNLAMNRVWGLFNIDDISKSHRKLKCWKISFSVALDQIQYKGIARCCTEIMATMRTVMFQWISLAEPFLILHVLEETWSERKRDLYFFFKYIYTGWTIQLHCSSMVPCYKVKYINIRNTYINIHKYKSYIKASIS